MIGRLEPGPSDPQSNIATFGNCFFIGNLGICASQFQLRSHSFFCSPLKRKLVGNIQSS